MIQRHIRERLLEAIDHAPAAALLGPRQAGKTTLALEIGLNAETEAVGLAELAERLSSF